MTAPATDRAVLAELRRAELMYDGPIPADLRAHILRGGSRQLAKLPIARARDRVRSCIAQVRLAQPGTRHAWALALARGWLRDALANYRAEQRRLHSSRFLQVSDAVPTRRAPVTTLTRRPS
jgi:1,2-phenylacetyl-CoA epoxidase catalytic subunit